MIHQICANVTALEVLWKIWKIGRQFSSIRLARVDGTIPLWT